MKLLNIKKIAYASALATGTLLSFNISAQSLVSGFQYINPGTGSTTSTSVSSAPYIGGVQAMSAYSNSFTLTAGHNYSLTYDASIAPGYSNIKFSSSANSSTPGTSVTVASSILRGSNTVLINSTLISSLLGTPTYVNVNGSTNTAWTFTLTSLTDAGDPTPPTPPAPTGPSVVNTQASVANTAQELQGTYTLQNAVLANSFSYDCTVFGANDVCVSAGGRNTAVSAANGLNNTSALLIAAYRALPSVRVGAYADQNLSVNYGGSTVNLGNNTPLLGLFAAWNEKQDGTGTEVKASLAYGQKNTTITRGLVGTGATASEAGSGSSQLNSQGAQITAKYGFALAADTLVSPYIGIRYTQNNMGGYTEGASSAVTTPLTYSALNTNATTALAGLGASYRFIPQATVFASAGVETDTNTANGTYAASGLTGLTPINFNANPVKTRPTATLGAYYDVEKNQRVGITGIYRQEPVQAVSTTTVMATYTIGM